MEDIKHSIFNLNLPSFWKSSKCDKCKVIDAYLLANNNYDLYTEGFFQKMLIIERKRSERSGKRFLLMLLDIHKLIKKNRINGTIKKLTKMLHNFTREIDIKGWYKQNSIIGIIYTEINGVNKESIIKKIKDNLDNTLDAEQIAMITISCLSFPEKNDKNENVELDSNTTLYMDNSRGILTKRVPVILKRIIDVTGSFLGIMVFFPFLLCISLLIKLSSKGPVFFMQKRIGYGGKEFTFLKFRSMYINNNNNIHKNFVKNFIHGNNDSNHGAKDGIYKMNDDPRITKVGKFLRKTSLDELPQLLNVLKGNMSLVGPRPPIQYEVEEYDIWHRRRVLEAKPGITGLWQVKGRSITKFEEMVRMDIQYIKRWSPLMDIKLILQTPWALFTAKGAY